LTGGHSGIEIHKHGGNANVLLGRLLQQLVKERGAGICKLRGGLADNAIPREARATVVVPYESLEGLEACLAQVQKKWREEFQNTDPDLSLRMHAPNDEEVTIPASCGLEEVTVPASCGTEEEDMSLDCDTESEAKGDKSIGYAEEEDTSIDGASEEDTSLNSDAGAAAKGDKSIGCVDGMEAERMCSYLTALPNGVQAMSKQMKGVVETSLNLGLMKLDACGLHTRFSVRSSLESAKAALLQTITLAASSAGGTVTITGDYPGWAYRSHSPLRDKMTKIYQDMYHSTPLTVAIHAGLECGIFCGKLEGLDCVSIGPNMGSVHTTEEYLEISSVKRVWEFLLRLLAEKE
jgi:dipeptidase D